MQWPATATWPWKGAVRSNRPGEPALEQDGAGPSRCGLRMQSRQRTFCCSGALWLWVDPAALTGGDSKVLWVLRGHPSWLLSPLVGEAVRHLQWSKLPSAVFACLVTRDASSLCHSP